jgi:adenine phosphoribosyltransferase
MAASEYILPYEGEQYYELKLGEGSWKLPLVQVAPDEWIAYFDSLGDVELIRYGARVLSKQMEDCDILLTSESKGIALAHEIAKNLGHSNFVVCRKEKKQTMLNPLEVEYKPITASTTIKLYIDARRAALLKGKRVGIVDDVISTGETVRAMENLVQKAGGKVVKKAMLLSEGGPAKEAVYLGILPIFKKKD